MRARIAKASIAACLAAVLTCACLFMRGERLWAAGVCVSAVWGLVNFALTVKLLEAAVLKSPGANVGRILLIKFPVLYLAGLLVLIHGTFPPLSLLSGLTITMLSVGMVYLWPKRT